ILPSRPRFEVTTYTIKKGDTIFDIAEKYGLKVQSIMWGNFETLGDNPDMISPDVTLVILPVDGVYHKWREGEGLNGVAKGYNVTPDAIIDWPGNHLTRESIGDYAKPNIAPGTMLMVPGGRRDYISQVAAVPRKSPGAGSYLGPGSCGTINGGAVGTGSFVWPVTGTITQGFLPEINHPAIDIGVPIGTSIAAADTGVVVYAGATYDRVGYGNLVIIDHGNGWQTLYAHQGTIYVSCGQGIYKGAAIGTVGMTGHTTGPHLHFEMRSDTLGKVNPLNFLP
ncbi:MAG: M23 family metallopeptidase, partial [Anaerolineaceae bacterium]|nr:M23 family metallopeptidase [Anaerolineaceae bacterium]